MGGLFVRSKVMGKLRTSIDETGCQFSEAQSVFFIGTAPLARDGHVNISPKGLDTFRILGPTTVAYLDLTGSGIETVRGSQSVVWFRVLGSKLR